MGLSTRARLIIVFVALVGLWAAIALWSFSSQPPTQSRTDAAHTARQGAGARGAPRVPVSRHPLVPTLSVEPIFDTTDPRRLAGFAENIFVARVQRKVSAIPLKSTIPTDQGTPQLQYEVRVSCSLKDSGPKPLKAGSLTTVDQMGGRDPETGKLYVVETHVHGEESTDYPLVPGQTYLFSTRYDPHRKFQTIVIQPQGDVHLTDDATSQATLELYKSAVADPVDPLSNGGGLASDHAQQGPNAP